MTERKLTSMNELAGKGFEKMSERKIGKSNWAEMKPRKEWNQQPTNELWWLAGFNSEINQSICNQTNSDSRHWIQLMIAEDWFDDWFLENWAAAS